MKCDNITLGYSFNKLFNTGDWKGLSGRIYGTTSNVFTITKYSGIDPEVFGGIDNSVYPRPISFHSWFELEFLILKENNNENIFKNILPAAAFC